MSKEKQIEEMAEEIYENTDLSIIEIAENIAEHLCNAGYRKQSEWISVDERLPERCGYYLGCTYKGFIMITPFFPVFANDKPEFCYDIVYWMPLPAPPKGE